MFAPGSRVCGWFCESNMRTLKFGLLLAAISLLAISSRAATEKEPSANLLLARQLNQAFIEVAEKVSPAVVVITVIEKPTAMTSDEEDDNSSDEVPRDFWKRFHRQFKDVPMEKSQGQGSGVIIRENGYILTNRHVVEEAESIEVRLQNGRTFKAKVRGMDPQSDVAVIKIDSKGLPTATFADSNKTRVGEFAIAIGAPFRLDYSVTFGHVSAKSRSDVVPPYDGGAMMDQDFIQTDANINPGNSGGPLVNIEGEVIGINTLIRGLRTGIGFAIPSSLAKEVSDQLIAEGKFTRAWLGVEIRTLRDDADFRELIKGPADGVVVHTVLPNGPAARSELKPTDIITAVDGRPVATAQQLRGEIRGKKIGKSVTLDVIRQGKAIQVKVAPGESLEPTKVASVRRDATSEGDSNKLGVTVHALTRELANQFGVEPTEGFIIMSVEKDMPADLKGLKAGDVITSLNQQSVKNSKEFRELLRRADLKKGIIVNVVSGKTARFEVLKQGEE
jgi:serine protease Do